MNDAKVRTAVLISGRGSNMSALIEAARRPEFPASVDLVLSNVTAAPGLARAASAGIATLAIPHGVHPSRSHFEDALDAALAAHAIDLVCLAGFMRLFTPGFVERRRGRIINVHPSLLPAFRGLNTHARALEAGCRIHGCTVHGVVPEVDAGPILAQAAVPVLAGDTPDTLGARVLAQEHVIYPRALRLVASALLGQRPTGGDPPAGAALAVPDRP